MNKYIVAIFTSITLFLTGCGTGEPQIDTASLDDKNDTTAKSVVKVNEDENNDYIVATSGFDKENYTNEIRIKGINVNGNEEDIGIYLYLNDQTVIKDAEGNLISYKELNVGQRVQWERDKNAGCNESHPAACNGKKITVLKPAFETDTSITEADAIAKAQAFIRENHVDENGPRLASSLEFNKVENKWEITISNREYSFQVNIDAETGEITNNDSLLTKLTKERIDSSDFELTIYVPERAQANEAFTARVTLKYIGEQDITLTYGKPYFTLEVDSEKGEQIYERVDHEDQGTEVAMSTNDTLELEKTITIEHALDFKVTANIYPLKADGLDVFGDIRKEEKYITVR
jgi:hypothetical protein